MTRLGLTLHAMHSGPGIRTGTSGDAAERVEILGRSGYKGAMTQERFGTVDGADAQLLSIKNANGLILKVTNYGATVVELHVPDKNGALADIVLGFENAEAYVKDSPFFGAIVGRVANRIANSAFELEGKTYTLAPSDAPHHLHGGEKGWDKVLWEGKVLETEAGPAIELTYVSSDGEEGYPGAVTAKTTYVLTNDNTLRVEMSATTDATTLVNMAHHTYWNLGGFDSGSIKDHELQLSASQYTPGVDGLVPGGQVTPVAGTPFDFTEPKLVGQDLEAAGGDPVGFDHNWVVDGEPRTLRHVATLRHKASGRVMVLEADQPGVQFYSGNFMDGSASGKGATYKQHSGLCLETQCFPNAINVPAWRDSVILKPGQTYQHTMIHRFSAE